MAGVGGFFMAGHLFDVAKAAYERTKEAPSDRAVQGGDVLVAIVFSVVALEAFISEAALLAASPPIPGETIPGSVRSFAAFAEEIEQSRGPVSLKYLVAKTLFTGQPYDKGVAPYQDFDDLIDLRHAIVHAKPEEKFPHSLVARLRSKNILAEFADTPASLFYWIGTRAVARWACNAASEMVTSIIDVAPVSRFREALVFFYGGFFGAVDTKRGMGDERDC